MYNTTLPALVNALPTYLRNLLIEFNCKASAGGASTAIRTVTGNKLALRSEIEIFGNTSFSVSGEGTQIQYYKTSYPYSRTKKRGHSSSAYADWWLRSPMSAYNIPFCMVTASGSSYISSSTDALGVAPFGCI